MLDKGRQRGMETPQASLAMEKQKRLTAHKLNEFSQYMISPYATVSFAAEVLLRSILRVLLPLSLNIA